MLCFLAPAAIPKLALSALCQGHSWKKTIANSRAAHRDVNREAAPRAAPQPKFININVQSHLPGNATRVIFRIQVTLAHRMDQLWEKPGSWQRLHKLVETRAMVEWGYRDSRGQCRAGDRPKGMTLARSGWIYWRWKGTAFAIQQTNRECLPPSSTISLYSEFCSQLTQSNRVVRLGLMGAVFQYHPDCQSVKERKSSYASFHRRQLCITSKGGSLVSFRTNYRPKTPPKSFSFIMIMDG